MNIKEILKRNLRSNENKINYSQLKNILNTEEAVLIDIRSEQEYKEGHLKSAINIPFYDFTNSITKKITDKNSCIIIYCQSGIKSSRVIKELKKLDYNNIYELEGGLDQIY